MNLIRRLSFSGCSSLGSGTEGTGKASLRLGSGNRSGVKVARLRLRLHFRISILLASDFAVGRKLTFLTAKSLVGPSGFKALAAFRAILIIHHCSLLDEFAKFRKTSK